MDISRKELGHIIKNMIECHSIDDLNKLVYTQLMKFDERYKDIRLAEYYLNVNCVNVSFKGIKTCKAMAKEEEKYSGTIGFGFQYLDFNKMSETEIEDYERGIECRKLAPFDDDKFTYDDVDIEINVLARRNENGTYDIELRNAKYKKQVFYVPWEDFILKDMWPFEEEYAKERDEETKTKTSKEDKQTKSKNTENTVEKNKVVKKIVIEGKAKNIEAIGKRFFLTEAGIKTLREFYHFKNNQLNVVKDAEEVKNTYYNLVLISEEPQNSKELMYELIRELGISDNDYECIKEKDMTSKFGAFAISDDSKCKLYIVTDCMAKPMVNVDLGSGSSVDDTRKIATEYEERWKSLTKYVKRHPNITFVLIMNQDVYNKSIALDNELNHRIFGHRIFMKEIPSEEILKRCLKRIHNTTIEFEDGFDEAFTDYFNVVYPTADLRGLEFIDDVINRIYSYYYRVSYNKNAKISENCIPPYDHDVRSVDDVMIELNSMIGLRNVKREFRKIYAKCVANKEENNQETFHMIFLGNPGTGKTTVARLAADLLCKFGVIKTNKLVEVHADDLFSGYINNSANKTNAVIEKARNGVLFIDEAYNLVRRNDGGKEVIDRIMKLTAYNNIESAPVVVILAGYEKEMEKLYATNPGLKDRFPLSIKFDNYNLEELTTIFHKKCEEHGYRLDQSAKDVLKDCILARMTKEFFANGRDMENLVNSLNGNWSNEYLDKMSEDDNQQIKQEKIFYAKHFAGLLPEREDVDINNLIGLASVKKQIKKFERKVQYIRTLEKHGMNNIPVAPMHMLFLGNPGTGKTVVARMIASDLYSIGVLKTKKCISIEAKDLYADTLSEVSKKLDKYVAKAMGGVLFIDEAYSITGSGSMGAEIVNELIVKMETYKKEMIFIFAGYPEDMRKFIQMNPGMNSRIGYSFHFDDYSNEELMDIFKQKMNKAGLIVTDEAMEKVADIMKYFTGVDNFGNGRFVEKVISSIIDKRSERNFTKDYNVFTEEDIPDVTDLLEIDMDGDRMLNPNDVDETYSIRVAYHELGHAVVAYALDNETEFADISIDSRADSGGRVIIKNKGRNKTETSMKNQLAVYFGGRNAEKIMLGDFSEGCYGDIQSAKEFANYMVNAMLIGQIGITAPSDLLREADNTAREIVKKYQNFIAVTTKDLMKGKQMSGEEFKARLAKAVHGEV